MPTKVRVPSVSRMRPVWAAVAAFAVAAAGARGATSRARFVRTTSARCSRRSGAIWHLPVNGILVRGKSLGGVQLGESASAVRALWGSYTILPSQPTTWLYMSPTGAPFGAGVSFRHRAVTAVFTLGGIAGWRTNDGLHTRQVIASFNNPGPSTTQTACIGYGAVSTRSGSAVTSIFMQGQAIYGFALTRPSEPICR